MSTLLRLYIFLISLIAIGCNCDCYYINLNYSKYSGNLRIDTIYTDIGDHNTKLASFKGYGVNATLPWFIIKPEIGDSIIKKEGSLEYILIKKDRTYIQRFDCENEKAIIIDQWENK